MQITPPKVRVRVHVSSESSWRGRVEVKGAWGPDPVLSDLQNMPRGETNVTVVLHAPATDISLWWPVGLGSQPLFNVTTRLLSSE